MNPILPSLNSFIPDSSTFSSCEHLDGEWELPSLHSASSLLLIPPHTLPLLQCGVPATASAPYELLQCASFPQAAVLEDLLQSGSFSKGVILQEWIALVWGPHRPQIQKTCFCVYSCPEASFFQISVLQSLQLPSEHIHLLQHGVSRGYSVVPAPRWSSTGCRGSPALGPGAAPLLSGELSCVLWWVLWSWLELCLEHMLVSQRQHLQSSSCQNPPGNPNVSLF